MFVVVYWATVQTTQEKHSLGGAKVWRKLGKKEAGLI